MTEQPQGNAISRFFGRVFSRRETVRPDTHRSVPAFVQEELQKRSAQGRSQTEAFFPMSGHWGSAYVGGGPYLSDGEKFPSGLIFSGMSPTIDHVQTQKNARETIHTSPAARAMIQRRVEAVVGDGLKLEPKPSAAILGMTDEQADEKARQIKERFNLWAGSRFASLDETMTLYQMQRLAELNAARDGEYFARLNYLREPGRPNPLAINMLDSAQIAGYPYTDTAGYVWSRDGIVRDVRGRETAYNIRIKNKNGHYENKIVKAVENGRRMMVHGFVPEYAGQTRGFAPIHHMIQEFAQLTNFTIAQIQKAIIQASIIMANETDADSIPTGNPFTLSGASPVLPPVDSPTSTTATELGTVPPYSPVNVSLSPGGIGIFNNKPGNKLKSFNDTAPSDNFAPFVEAFLAVLCSSYGVPYEVVLERFDSNYSASRGALIMFYRYACILRGEHKSDFLTHVYESWFSEEIAAGRLTAPGWLDPVLRLAWLSADWIGPLMPDVDPGKSVDAARDAIEANLSNVEQEAQKYNGSDAAKNRAINDRILKGAGRAPWNSGQKSDEKQQMKTVQKAVAE